MKLKQPTSPNTSGSVLLISLIIGAIFCTLLGSFLFLTQFQIRAVARSQTWNNGMVAAEAGVEEGLSMINRYAHSATPLGDWPSATYASGWSSLGGNVYFLQRTINSSDSYRVYITNLGSAPVIKSVGYSYFPESDRNLARAIEVRNTSGSFFLGGVLAKKGININGSAIFDSFNSQDPAYSTGGQWDITKRKDGGNVGSIASNVVAAVTANGSADIYGQIATSPNSTVSMQGNAAAGSLAWVGAGNKGIQSGWSRNDLNTTIPDAPALPVGTYANLPSAGNVVLNAGGGMARYVASSTYQMSSHNFLLITNGTVVIDAQKGVKIDAQASILIAPGSKLILYLGTENTQLNGQGLVNTSGFATNCIVYGKNNCQQIEINGGSAFKGYLYAPYADITVNGNAGVSGAMVGNTFQINGNMMVHYDESLREPQPGSSIYRVLSWREVSP